MSEFTVSTLEALSIANLVTNWLSRGKSNIVWHVLVATRTSRTLHSMRVALNTKILIAAKQTSRISCFFTKLPLKQKRCYLLQKCWILLGFRTWGAEAPGSSPICLSRFLRIWEPQKGPIFVWILQIWGKWQERGPEGLSTYCRFQWPNETTKSGDPPNVACHFFFWRVTWSVTFWLAWCHSSDEWQGLSDFVDLRPKRLEILGRFWGVLPDRHIGELPGAWELGAGKCWKRARA
jgi:hypothetical protein